MGDLESGSEMTNIRQIEQSRKDLITRFTPEGVQPHEFRDRSKIQSSTLETAKMLRDTGMPPEFIDGGPEAVNALESYEDALQYVKQLLIAGVNVLKVEHINEINKLVNGNAEGSGVTRTEPVKSTDRKSAGLVWNFPAPELVDAGLNDIVDWQISAHGLLSNAELGYQTADLLVRLHPYRNGNGRTAMVVEKFLMQ